ncbi:MAG: sodium:solute symporter family transporter [Planctomycetaceae bacterium]
MNEPSLSANAGLESLDYAAIAFYFVLTFGIALWFGRKQKNTEDFFVGGRHMPWFAVGLSILATLFSTLSYLGMPGEMIKNGFGVFAGLLAIPASMSVVLFVWIPFFMRLRMTSAYEYLEKRFNYSVRLLGAGLFILLRLGWMSMVIFAASMALDRIKGPDIQMLSGDDIYWWIGIVGVIAAIYTSVGGIQAMIWTDVLQCLLLLAGVILVIGSVMYFDGTGPSDWWEIASTTPGRNNLPPVFSWDVTVRVTIVFAIVNNFFWTICTHGSDQVVLQRYFTTSSLKNARRSYLSNLFVEITMASLLALCGLALLAYYLNHAELVPAGLSVIKDADKLFPHFLGHSLPAGVAGLIISAFLCDAIQTLESGVNSITAVATNDIVPRLRHGRERIMSDLMFARLLSIVITLAVTCNAYFVAYKAESIGETIVGMMPKFFNMFVGPLSALFIIGMFFPRCTARSAIPGALSGFLVSIIWSWWAEILGTGILGVNEATGKAIVPTFLLAIAVPSITSLSVAWILSWIVETGEDHSGRKYSWKYVTSQPIPEETPS